MLQKLVGTFYIIHSFTISDQLQKKTKDPPRHLLGPKTLYKPQTEKASMKPVIEPMNVTKGLTCLGLLTGRGMDNGQAVR